MSARIVFIPLNIVEELVKPVTLSLRLFGNIFAGGSDDRPDRQQAGTWSSARWHCAATGHRHVWALAVWKAFDVLFIGFIQAFIFMLLTVIYFGMAREGLEARTCTTLRRVT